MNTTKTNILKLFQFCDSQKIFILLSIVIIYFFAFCVPTDPDMGWHLGDGKYLMEHHLQVARHDIFSYTMPNFPLIMHEWVMDIVMYNIYAYGNLFIMSLFFAAITAAAFIVAALGVPAKTEYKFIAAILGIIASGPILGVRIQMVSLLGLAIVVFIIFRFRQNQNSRMIYFFPLLFFLWVNMHGGFAIGLFFIGVFLCLEYLKKTLYFIFFKIRKIKPVLVINSWLEKNTISFRALVRVSLVFFLSFLATLANPYGWRVYIEVITTAFDKYAKTFVAEWFPVSAGNPMSSQFIIYLVLLGILLVISYRKIDFTYLALALVFLYMALSSWRHLPLFMIVSIPLWVSIVEYLVEKELSDILQKKWFLACFLAAVIVITWQRIKFVPVSYSVEKIAEMGNYPLEAVKYMKANPKEGNLFNEYNWGGFLIWQYPEKKLYIDGRMPSWRQNGFSVLEEFNTAFKNNEGLENVLNKYNDTEALVYNNIPNQLAFRDIGWKAAYQDNLSVVFERP